MWHHKLVFFFPARYLYLYYVHWEIFSSFIFYVSEMKMLRLWLGGAEEIATVHGFLEKEKYWIFWLSNLVLDLGLNCEFLWKHFVWKALVGCRGKWQWCVCLWRRWRWLEREKSKTTFWRRVGSCDSLKAFKGIPEGGEGQRGIISIFCVKHKRVGQTIS